jgi:hypothetical protein
MSETELPEISVIDPDVLKELVKLCAGEKSPHAIAKGPCLVDIGDEIYVAFTDGASALLVSLDLDEDVPMSLPASVEIQEEFGRITARWGSPYALYHSGISVERLLAWMREDLEGCPKCKGKKECFYPRHGTDASTRENPDVYTTHEGVIEEVVVDRRRLLVPFELLGVEEGDVDLAIVVEPAEGESPAVTGVAIIGEGWRVYAAGKVGREECKRPVFTISG